MISCSKSGVTWSKNAPAILHRCPSPSPHPTNQIEPIDRVESAVLLSIVGGGLVLCVFGATVYDIGRAFSVW
jgi:hypothetical protein